MGDSKNLITLGIGCSPSEIGYFILDGLSSLLASAGFPAVTVSDAAGRLGLADNSRHLITMGIGCDPDSVRYFILDGFCSDVMRVGVSGVSLSDAAYGAAAVSDSAVGTVVVDDSEA